MCVCVCVCVCVCDANLRHGRGSIDFVCSADTGGMAEERGRDGDDGMGQQHDDMQLEHAASARRLRCDSEVC